MLFRIKEIEARTGYKLWVRFEDEVEGEVDLSDLVGKGVFKQWEDPKEFMKVSLNPETGAPSWPGELDIAPDSLYRELTTLTTR
jgi:hypothetical protein